MLILEEKKKYTRVLADAEKHTQTAHLVQISQIVCMSASEPPCSVLTFLSCERQKQDKKNTFNTTVCAETRVK